MIESPHSSPSAVWYFLLAAALYLLTAGWNLSGQSISNPEEARYACAARQMLRDGEWIVPRFNGDVRLVKPILFYWVIAATGKIGTMLGLGLLTGMRLGPLSMGLFAIAATFLITRKLTNGSARAGFVAAVVLMTCNEFHKLSREVVIEMTITALLTWAWYFALVALDRIAATARAWAPLLGFYVCLGLACMAKGPLPVAGFVVLPFLVYLAMTKRLNHLSRAGLWWGVPLTIAVGFWWFYLLDRIGHRNGISEFFVQENLYRILGEQDPLIPVALHIHPWPWLRYFVWMPEGFAPWILAVPLMLWYVHKKRQAGSAWIVTDAAKFILCAEIVAFAIIGLSASKRTLYLLPLYPPFAIWAGWIFNDVFATNETGQALSSAYSFRLKMVYAVLGLALALALAYEIVLVPKREKALGNVAFFAALASHLDGRKLVTLNESANEAVWYLDLDKPIVKLNYPGLKEKFFEAENTVLLLKGKDLVKTAELKPALRFIAGFECKRGKDTYSLATPDPDHKPDPKLFEHKSKDSGKETGDD